MISEVLNLVAEYVHVSEHAERRQRRWINEFD